MKKLLIFALFFLTLLMSCQSKEEVIIFNDVDSVDYLCIYKYEYNSNKKLVGYVYTLSSVFFNQLKDFKGIEIDKSKDNYDGNEYEFKINDKKVVFRNDYCKYGSHNYEISFNIDEYMKVFNFVDMEVLSIYSIYDVPDSISFSKNSKNYILNTDLKIYNFLNELSNVALKKSESNFNYDSIITLTISNLVFNIYDYDYIKIDSDFYNVESIDFSFLSEYNESNVDEYKEDSGELPWV